MENEKIKVKENVTENSTHSIEGILESLGVNDTKGEKNQRLLKILRHRKNGFISLHDLKNDIKLLEIGFVSSFNRTAYFVLSPPIDYESDNINPAYTIEKVNVKDDKLYFNKIESKKDVPGIVQRQAKHYFIIMHEIENEAFNDWYYESQFQKILAKLELKKSNKE